MSARAAPEPDAEALFRVHFAHEGTEPTEPLDIAAASPIAARAIARSRWPDRIIRRVKIVREGGTEVAEGRS